MSDIAALEKEIRQMLETFHLDIESLNQKDPSQRAKQILKCQNKSTKIGLKIDALGIEIDQLDKASKIEQMSALRALKIEFKDLNNRFEAKMAENAPSNTKFVPEEKKLDEMTGPELIQKGHQTQQQSKKALTRVLGMVEDGKAKADAINLELKIHGDRIGGLTEKVKDVQVEIKRADQYIRYFARQVYRDKLLLCLIFLCIVAIIVIIIMKIKKGNLPTVQDIIKNA